MKRRVVAMLCALAMAGTMFGTMPQTTVHAASGTTYYVSSLHGDNSNSGTSEDQAWETLDKLEDVAGTLSAGDRILLESGSVFQGFIHLQDVHGTEEAPIVISSYGEGANPVINGNGQGVWYQDYVAPMDNTAHKSSGYVSSTILLYDTDYVKVSNLEITNRSSDGEYFDDADKLEEKMDRTGVAGIAKNDGVM